MSLIATNHRKNILAPQVYPQKPENEVFGRKRPLSGHIVVLYIVPNFRDREPRFEGSKMRPRPRLCVPRLRPRHKN